MENNRINPVERELEIPVSEPERQYYFIERARKNLEKMKKLPDGSLLSVLPHLGAR